VRRYSTPRPITADDVVTGFDCGEPSLNDWLRRRALTNQDSGASRCFVTSRDSTVAGYYALATGSVQRVAASPRIARSMPEPIPVILLGRLAVDLKEQGHGLGAHLLRDVIARTVQVADSVGVRALLVHALNERARAFYLRYDFEPSPIDPLQLMLLLKDARAIVRAQS
jgi:GNAT superfamily N-acetyltransferase